MIVGRSIPSGPSIVTLLDAWHKVTVGRSKVTAASASSVRNSRRSNVKTNKLELAPKFRTEGKPPKVKVFLQCSMCDKDIREVKPNDIVDISHAHLCTTCDPEQRIRIPSPQGESK